MDVTEDGVGFKRKPCPSCLKETMVEVIDQMKPTGVSALSTGGFGMEGVVLRSHEECRSCGYNSREAETEVQDERPPTNDDPA
jgi:ribosomal protein S27AE